MKAGFWTPLRRPSLQRRLAVILVAAALLSTILATGILSIVTLWGRSGWLDQANAVLARGMAAGLEGETRLEHVQARVAGIESVIEASNRDSGMKGEFSEEAIQVVHRELGLVYRTSKAPRQAFAWSATGVHRHQMEGHPWWVATASTLDGKLQVHVATGTRDRLYLLRMIGTELGAMLLLLFLFSSVLVLLGVRTGLKPLFQLAREVQDRSPAALEPLEPPVIYEETRPLIQAINRLFAQARQHMDHQRTFLADVTHELRTPLAVIGAQAHRLATAPSPQERHLAHGELMAGLERGARVVGQLLTIAHLEAPGPVSREPVELEALLRSITADLAPLLLEAGCELGCTSSGPTVLHADAANLRSAVENLVRNAGLYAGPDTLVDLALIRRSGEVLIQVLDNGPGVPEPHRSRLSERFFRVPGTLPQGSGLGLAIAQRVAEDHGGTLELGVGMGGRGFGATLRLPCPEES